MMPQACLTFVVVVFPDHTHYFYQNAKLWHAYSSDTIVLDAHMRGSRKFCWRGSTFDNDFFWFVTLEGREDPSQYYYKRAIIDPPAKRHLNGVSMECRYWPKN